MKSSIDLKDLVLNLLINNINIDNAIVIDAYERKNVDLPVKSVIISVGVNGENLTVGNNRDVNYIYDNKIELSINIFTPLNFGGKFLSQIIAKIKTILSDEIDEKYFTFASSKISHKSSAMAYSSEVLVTFFDVISNSNNSNSYDNIVFYINGSRNLASKIQVDFDIKYFNSKSYGENNINNYNIYSTEYIITIFCDKEIFIPDVTDYFAVFCSLDDNSSYTYYNSILKEFSTINNYDDVNSYKYVFKSFERR